ncbi:MAG: response regulator [Mariprofundales bacterium]|nr:response regulator [Mariprofundales bacterium]
MINSPRILLIEDNPLDIRLLQEVCNDDPNCDLHFECAHSLTEASDMMAITQHDAVLLDLGLPESDGLDTLKSMLAMQPQHGHSGAIIVLTSVNSDVMGDAAIALGAQDFLVKGTIEAAQLKRSVRYACERQRLTRQQEESSTHIRMMASALDQASDVVLITNIDGNICYVNQSFTKVTGFSVDEAIGHNPSMLSSSKQSPSFYRRLWETINHGEHWQSEMIDRRKNGTLYPCHIDISPICNSDGETTHFVGIQRDLTEQKMMEEQLRQSQKMEAIGTLTGGIAHDFNNMLAGMMGNLFLLRKRIDNPDKAIKRIDTINGLCERAADMVRKMMAFGRNDMLQMQPLELNPLIKEIYKMMLRLLPENICFRLNCTTQPLTITGDATQLHQILLNLINNARDAVAEINRPPTIDIALAPFTPNADFLRRHPDAKEREFAHLQVKDNGSGADADTLQHLTEPFFTTKEVGSGTGLGLSMVDGGVAQHLGYLELESQPDQGMTINIYLPLTHEKGQTAKLPQLSKEVIPGRGETILVADDESAVREMMQELLTSMGYPVLLAQNGQQALELFHLHRHAIALVILDVVMPEMSGPDAYRQMQQTYADLPVIFASGYERSKVPSELLGNNGHRTCLSKPFHAVRLSEVIREVLS